MAINLNGKNGLADFLGDTVPLGGFKLRRASATMQGFSPAVDDRVQAELQELNELLTRRIVDGRDHKDTVREWAALPLTPKRYGVIAPNRWAKPSLAGRLNGQVENKTDETLAEVLDGDAKLARVRYAFQEELGDRYNELDLAQRTVLELDGLRDLLLARGAMVKGITNVKALFNFVAASASGVADIVDYALIGAARRWVDDRSIELDDIKEDDGETVTALREANLSISEMSFEPAVERLVEGRIANQQYDALITKAKLTWLTSAQRERLYVKIKNSPVPVTATNAPVLLPLYAAQVVSSSSATDDGGGSGADDPFKVEFFIDDSAQLAVSSAAVKCASQLYYVMTLGDELGVFDAMRYFTHRYLFQEGFAVEDRVLRRDLEDYVFNEQFLGYDDEAGEQRLMHVTHEAERRSFYQQVFDLGGGPLPDGAMANPDFGRLWKILMLESARYLERAQSSPNPDTYVSRQNVMQAVEDLQYNLSTSCVGMSTVMTPLMHAELEFVVKRIFSHEEVRRHLVPSGGSWWKVVERLAAAQGQQLRASVLNNKARLGYSILRAIAEYTSSRFEQDAVFSAFISDVDAFITTQSILQDDDAGSGDALTDDEDAQGTQNGYGSALPGMPSIPGMPAGIPGMPSLPGMPAGATNGSARAGSGGGGPTGPDDWNF